jgi:hypothetical protein
MIDFPFKDGHLAGAAKSLLAVERSVYTGRNECIE